MSSSATATARVPVMMTHDLEQRLRAADYTDDEINAMTPAEGWAAVGGLPDARGNGHDAASSPAPRPAGADLPTAAQVLADLLAYPNWVAWRVKPGDKPGDRPNKVPVNPHTGRDADSTDPATWGTFDQARARAIRDGLAGVGFVFTDSPIAGIDLDHCRNADTGTVEPWAAEIISEQDSYTEVSPSGTGVHVFVKGDKPGKSCKKKRADGGEIELYDTGRFFTFTGQRVDGCPDTIHERQDQLTALYRRVFGDPTPAASPLPDPSSPVDLEDCELLDRMRSSKHGPDIEALISGDTSKHGNDDSAADLALCNYLAFWTGKDAARMDRLFRTSGLMRAKWDTKRGDSTYGADTIRKAIEDTAKVYTPARQMTPAGSPSAGCPTPAAAAAVKPYTLAEVIAVYRQYLHMPDAGPLCFDLGCVVANRFPGDAVWGLKVGAPGSGKTETLNGLANLPHVRPVATLTVASLLSGTSKREKSKTAKGGLLREIGDFGIIALKDFGSIMSMNRDARAELLAALREIYDGGWVRYVGSDGGQCLQWAGKVGIVGCATPAIDQAHGVMGTLGERFVLYRMPTEGSDKRALMALTRNGDDHAMRADIAGAMTGLFASITIPATFDPFTEAEQSRFVALAELTAKARSAVIRDSYHRDIELILGAEVPTRLVIVLAKLYRAFVLIGMTHAGAWELVKKVALDSMPQIRRQALETLIAESDRLTTKVIALKAGYPTDTMRRALEDLTVYGVLTRTAGADGKGGADLWQASDWTCEKWAALRFSEMLEEVYRV